ncbi:MAG: prepilin peptidase, partial [Candidatus Margulisiibacteriota bacterium]
QLWLKKEVMGEGDYFVGALLGAFLGWQGVLLSIFLAYLLAGSVLAFLLWAGKVSWGQYVPFGPALVTGGVVALFLGREILNWYLSFLW